MNIDQANYILNTSGKFYTSRNPLNTKQAI